MRPVLVLLNGLPASGKSTLARSWCEREGADLALALDVDVVRGMLGGWRDRRIEAGLAARAIALAATRAHLAAGHDVLVPQYVGRPRFIDELADVAREVGAVFVECVLVTDPVVAAERFSARAAASSARGQDEGGLDEPMSAIHASFEEFLRRRPAAVRLDAREGDLLEQLDAAIAVARSA